MSKSLRLTATAAAIAFLTGCGSSGSGSDAGSAKEGDRPAAAKARNQINGADRPQEKDFPRPKPGQSMQEFANSLGFTGTQVALATSVFTPGHNRVAFGVIAENNVFVYGPTALYTARTPNSKEIVGPYLAPADLLMTEPPFRSQTAATEADPFAAVYSSAGVEFERPGKHVLLVVTKLGGKLVAAPSQLQVRKDDDIPAPGDRAPAVETDTFVSSGGDKEAVDTRRPFDDMHDDSFADVVGKKPVVLLFATPQLCQSRVCGPVVDIALQLKAEYGDRVTFIHQEVYVDNDLNKGLREPLRDFNLQTEPWLFAVDKSGRIAARLEGSFGVEEVERAVQAAIASGA